MLRQARQDVARVLPDRLGHDQRHRGIDLRGTPRCRGSGCRGSRAAPPGRRDARARSCSRAPQRRAPRRPRGPPARASTRGWPAAGNRRWRRDRSHATSAGPFGRAPRSAEAGRQAVGRRRAARAPLRIGPAAGPMSRRGRAMLPPAGGHHGPSIGLARLCARRMSAVGRRSSPRNLPAIRWAADGRSLAPVAREVAIDQPRELHRREGQSRHGHHGHRRAGGARARPGLEGVAVGAHQGRRDVRARRDHGLGRHSPYLDDADRQLAVFHPADVLGRRTAAVCRGRPSAISSRPAGAPSRSSPRSRCA